MRSADNIKKLIKNTKIKTNPKTTKAVLDGLKSQMDHVQGAKTNATRQNIWRTIMKTKTAKLATSLVVIVVSILFMSLLDKTTAPAFGMNDVLAAMAKAEWLHKTWEITEASTGFDFEGQVICESWTSINPQREIAIYTNGSIKFTEYTKNEIKAQKYDPQTQILTITHRPTPERKLHASIEDMVLGGLSNLEKTGKGIKHENVVYKGDSATIINIDFPRKNGTHRKYSIVVDAQTYLPRRMTYCYEDLEEKAVANVTFDYPETGPTDIYQAGAPRNAQAKVIDHRPSAEFLEAIRPYRQARENLPGQRIIVDIENEINGLRRVCIVYTNDSIQRFEQLMWVKDDMPPNAADFDAILDWARSAKSQELGIQLFDGDVVCRVERDYRDRWSKRKYATNLKCPEFVVGGLIHRGWPKIGDGQIVYNDYSNKNNLLCIATSKEPRFNDNKLIEPAEKKLFYIDPERDYMCVRIEAFSYLTPPFDELEIDDLFFEPNEIPTEPYWVTEITEFEQTDTGQWYPKEITTNRLSWWLDYPDNTDTPGDEKFVIRLYLDSKPEFPEGIFDPENLPYVGE